MKNFIIILFVPLLAQAPKETIEIAHNTELNIINVEDYIKNKLNKRDLNLLIIRSLQSHIASREWVIADTTLNHYTSLINDYYDNYDLSHIQKIRTLIQQKTDNNYNVNFINNSVNTKNNETDPLIVEYEDERYLYFTRKPLLEDSNDEDIFVGLEKKNFIFSDIVPLPFNTNDKPEAVSYVSAQEPITLIYYGHYGGDLRGNLYLTNFNDNDWTDPAKLTFPVNTNNFELDGILYQDEYLLFASDRPDHNNYNPKGKLYNGDYWGNSDIYISQRLDYNEWTEPINLGKIINTKYGERTPWISKDGLTLYFSSDGHPGLGRMDVFKSTRTDINDWTSWTVPQNLGKDINTAFNDIGYSIYEDEKNNKQFAFFSTSSNKIVNDYDIAYVQLSRQNSPMEEPIIVSGKLEDEDGNPLPDVPVIAEDKETGEKLAEALTDENGEYKLPIPKDSDPIIYPNTSDFIPQTKPFNNTLDNVPDKSDELESNKDKPNDGQGGNSGDGEAGKSESDPTQNSGADGPKQAPRNNDGTPDLNKIEEDYNKYLKKDGIEKPPGFRGGENNELIPPLITEIPSINDFDKYYEKYEYTIAENKFNFDNGVFDYLEPLDFKLSKPGPECESNLLNLNTITFSSKSSELSDKSKNELNRLSNYLKENQNYFMLIVGHTDSDSSRSYNSLLSKDRSMSVKNYLVSKGAKEFQFFTQGKGEDMLLTDESTRQLKAKNRRVEYCIKLNEPNEMIF